ncbi:hypothetical protein NDU88_007642 [Pleurodeles waltl]|uniref:Integron gene cassette protein n=1 Tax=Pleurodeles waltl TaxID=8319 RepID=A0AAV7NTW0_PLEWA|nr:hypothetical protein NDU88_007642 [Pleurodeles waltl]
MCGGAVGLPFSARLSSPLRHAPHIRKLRVLVAQKALLASVIRASVPPALQLIRSHPTPLGHLRWCFRIVSGFPGALIRIFYRARNRV